jgi:transcriptional regulator with XRE-family HTH domain
MGRERRQRPKHLAKKLLLIREGLGQSLGEKVSQADMLKLLGLTKPFSQDYISAFEKGKREPPLPVLLRYAKLADVYVDVLIDDTQKLPKLLASKSAKPKARKSR